MLRLWTFLALLIIVSIVILRTLGCTMKMTTPTGGGRTQIRGIHRSGGSGTSKEAGSSSLFSSSTPPPNMEELFLPGKTFGIFMKARLSSGVFQCEIPDD